MKKITILLFIFLTGSVLHAQNKNIFWDKEFWKTNPSIEVIEQKITEGNSAEQLNPHGFDATTYAILENYSNPVIKHLLSKEGNDINKLTHDKRTYIFWASYKGNIELVKHLIDSNARLDLRDSHKFSPLTFAAVAGQTNTEIYDVFIKNGIDIKADVNENGANALLLIIPHLKDISETDYFVSKGLDLNSVDANGNGVFNYVAVKGNKVMLAKLIEKGVPYKNSNNKGGNAILYASHGSRSGHNSLEFFKYLEGLGIAPNITNKQGVTPLHNIARGNKDLATFTYFTNKGVNVNQVDNEGNTALIKAAPRNTLEVISQLAKDTKSINHTNNDGESVLTNALSNKAEVVTFLIKKGSDVTVVDKKGNNLSYYLVKSFRPKKEDEFNQKLEVLSANGFDVKKLQKNGNSLLHLAVEENNFALVKKVKSLVEDKDIKNKDGLTALHMAAMNSKDSKILNYLITEGANKNTKTDFDESVYDLAKENELLNKQDINFLK